MTTMIALFRNLNNGISDRLPMAELRHQAERIGLEQVASYSSTGNLVFESAGKTADEIEDELEFTILSACGYDASAFVRTKEEFAVMVAANPFSGLCVDLRKVRVFFMERVPDPSFATAMQGMDWGGADYLLAGREIYFQLAQTNSKVMGNMARLERSTGLIAAERTWGTVMHLHRICQAR